MYKRWLVLYKGHKIEIENTMFSAQLLIDGALASEHRGVALRGELTAVIPQGDGAGEEVRCVIGGFWRIGCSVSTIGGPMNVSVMKPAIQDRVWGLVAFGLAAFGGAATYSLTGAHIRSAFLVGCTAYALAGLVWYWRRWRRRRLGESLGEAVAYVLVTIGIAAVYRLVVTF
jgi:hypothetical protein